MQNCHSCKNDHLSKKISMQNYLLLKKCTLVQKCLYENDFLSNFFHLCKFDTYPFCIVDETQCHTNSKISVHLREFKHSLKTPQQINFLGFKAFVTKKNLHLITYM